MDLGLSGKIAFVAGGSSGLGLAIAEALAKEGARVGLCSRSGDKLTRAAAGIKHLTGQEAEIFPADLTTPGTAAEAVRQAQDRMGGVDILVTNNGGPPPGGLDDFGDEDWLRAFRLGCLSALELIKAVLPGMKERGWGRIVSMTSVSVKEPIPNLILSNGTRVGLVGAAKTISQEVGSYGITVNCLATGWTRTERVMELAKAKTRGTDRTPQDFLKAIAKDIPLGRMNEPEEVAAAVLFLASEPARAITGVTLAVDGGACTGIM